MRHPARPNDVNRHIAHGEAMGKGAVVRGDPPRLSLPETGRLRLDSGDGPSRMARAFVGKRVFVGKTE